MKTPMDLALLTPAEMAEADRLTIGAGKSGAVLMERAGRAVAAEAMAMLDHRRRVSVLVGPGHNGGDGFVAARCLAEAGCDVRVFSIDPNTPPRGDAEVAAARWNGPVLALARYDPAEADLVVDALFGAGLDRRIEGAVAVAMERTREESVAVLSVDLPSGVSGATGAILETAFEATATVTFFRRKPGHLLQPGRRLCGRVKVADIGIADGVLDAIAPRAFANGPALWPEAFRAPAAEGHKYGRGHVVVFSGGATTTGAARLSAIGALRGGAGLVTLFSPPSALLVNAAHLTAIMLRRCEGLDDLDAALEDQRLAAFVLGPGFGVGAKARDYASSVLREGRALVLDADAITSFADAPERLFAAVGGARGAVVLTPHQGEFARLFPDIAADADLWKLGKARAAAERSGATVVLKGSDTVIAGPSGRAAINETGTPWLATAGSGDVLAGMIAGHLANGLGGFEAAAAAVWMHGRAAEICGPGLIAEDLPGALPAVFRALSDEV